MVVPQKFLLCNIPNNPQLLGQDNDLAGLTQHLQSSSNFAVHIGFIGLQLTDLNLKS